MRHQRPGLTLRSSMRVLVALTALGLAAQAEGASSPKLVAALDSAKGVKLRPWSRNVAAKLDVITDSKLVTQGAASLCIKAKSGEPIPGRSDSRYVSIQVSVSPFSMRKRMLMVDVASRTPKHTRAFYVRLRDANGREVGSWGSWRLRAEAGKFRTIRLQQGQSFDGLTYEAKRVKAPNARVKTIEIITGTRDKNVEFDLIVDNIRLGEAMAGSLEQLDKPRKLVRKTGLRGPVQVVAPESAKIETLLAALKAVGGEVTLVDAQAGEPDWGKTTVVIGNVDDTPAVLPLYAHGYCFSDAAFPGEGGYELRIIHDPFGHGVNVVFIGASDHLGLAKGIRAFLMKLSGGPVLDPFIDVQLGGEAKRALAAYFKPLSKKYIAGRVRGARKRLDSGGARGVCSEMASLGLAYRLNGRADRAVLFKGLMYEYEKWAYDKNRRYGAHEGQWGMDVDFTAYRLIPSWDAVEECAVFTDADRLRITRLLAAFVQHDTYMCGRSVNRGPGPRHNHQTFPCLGLYYAGRYFSQCVNSQQAAHWLDTAANCFGCQATYLKAREDAAGYQWLVPQHTQMYGFAAGDRTQWLSGNARRLCNLAMTLTDNLGHQPAFGDHSGFGGWGGEMALLHYAAFVHGDGRYEWCIDKKQSIRRRFQLGMYARKLAPLEPVDLAGVQWSPVARIMYEHYKRSAKVAYPETFDKIAFRQDFDEGTEYLLLDGINDTSHGHYDGNGILRLVAHKRLWLEDGDYIKSLPKFHNTLLVFRDGASEKPSVFAKVEEIADFPRAGFAQTLMPDYAGADWRRAVVWVKGRGFVVLDTVTARKPGDYRVRCVWRGMGEVQRDSRSMVLGQQGEALRIMSAGRADMLLEDDATRGYNWRRYPYAPPVVRVLNFIDGATLAADESITIASVLRPSSPEDAGDLAATMIAPGVARVEADGAAFVCGAYAKRRPEPVAVVDGLATNAALFRFDAQGFEVVNATRVRGPDFDVIATAPVCMSVDAATGAARVMAREDGALVVRSRGATRRVSFARGRSEMELGPIAYAPKSLAATQDQVVACVPPKSHEAEGEDTEGGFKELWRLHAAPSRLLLTNNTGRFGAIDIGASCKVRPAPRERNLFNAVDPNRIAALHDGGTRSTATSVMWPIDQPVTLGYDLQREVKLSEIVLRVWFGSGSSKGESFMTERVRVRVSRDNFAGNERVLLDYKDDGKHPDWGAPLELRAKASGALAQWVRIECTPRKKSSVYLAEVEIWGDGESIPRELRKGQSAADFLCIAPGPDGLIALGGSHGGVYLVDRQGKQLWRNETGEKVPSVWCGDLDGDGAAEVVAGSRDGKVYCYSLDGKPRWTFTCEPYHGRSGALVCVFAADVDGDGKKEVIAGADNWHFHLLGCDGSFRWRYETVHRSTCGAAADLDGDGKQEIVGCTEYYYSTVISHDGKGLWRQRGGPCMNCVDVGDLDGDGQLEVAFGSANGVVYVANCKGRQLWTFDTGDEITSVRFVDLDGDGKVELAASSLNFNVYLFDAQGRILWRRDCGAPVVHMAVLEGRLIAWLQNGILAALDGTGEVVARRRVRGAIHALAGLGKTGDGLGVSVSGEGLLRFQMLR